MLTSKRINTPLGRVLGALLILSIFWIGWGGYIAQQIHNREGILWQDADDYMWLSLCQESRSEGRWTAHYTYLDNFPEGRPVHWASANMLALRALSYLGQKLRIAESFQDGLNKMSIWWNPLLLFIGTCGLALLCWRAAGSTWGLFVWLLPLTSPAALDVFSPLHPDQQGLLIVLGSTFVLTLGAGYLSKGRTYYELSGIALGLGMWVSAINLAPYFAAAVFGALVARLLSKESNPIVYRRLNRGWKIIGWWAASLSLAGWLWEYGFSLPLIREVNSPLHSLFILASAQVVASLYSKPLCFKTLGIWTSICLTCLGVGFLFYSPAISTPAMVGLHKTILEMRLPNLDWAIFLPFALWASLLMICWFDKRSLASSFALGITEVFLLGGVLVTRLIVPLVFASTPLLALCLSKERSPRWTLKAGMLLLLVTLLGQTVATTHQKIKQGYESPTHSSLCLKQAKVIQEDCQQRGGLVPLVFHPGSGRSVMLSSYLKRPSLQSVYWENTAGLEKALRLWVNKDIIDAGSLLYSLGITHIVSIPNDDPPLLALCLYSEEIAKKDRPIYSGSRFLSEEGKTWLVPLQENKDIYFVDRNALKAWLENKR